MKFLPHENPHDLSSRAVVKALCEHWEYRQTHQEGVISSCRQIDHLLNASRFQIAARIEQLCPARSRESNEHALAGLTPDFLDALLLELKTAAFSMMINSGTPKLSDALE
jgi:hypothetical protein